MNMQEAITRAENGDIGAMVDRAVYHESDLENALIGKMQEIRTWKWRGVKSVRAIKMDLKSASQYIMWKTVPCGSLVIGKKDDIGIINDYA